MICQVVWKNRKLVWWKLSKRPICWRQMPMPIFLWQRMQHINVWRMVGGNMPTYWHICVSPCVSGTMLKQSQRPRRFPREHAECFLSIVGHTNAEQRYHQWGQLMHFYHTNVRRGPPPHFSGSYMLYVSFVDVRKTWERTATLNGRLHKAWRS